MNDYIPTAKASEITLYSPRQILKLCETGRIRFRKIQKNKIEVKTSDIVRYANAHPVNVYDVVWNEIKPIEGEVFYPLFGYDGKYFVTNKGRVINISLGRVLTPYTRTTDGYKTVVLTKNGQSVGEYLHRLIAITQCPNALFKNNVHHIKKSNPSIDKASNLLWVTKPQHDKLHKLLNDNKTNEYKELVKEIKKENRQKIYKIPHLDYPYGEHINFYMYLTADGYKLYKSGKYIPSKYIIRETYELK